MFEGACNIESISLDDYSVALMYKDIDDDKVLIFTDDDIITALKEYSSKGTVKIVAEVSVKKQSQKGSSSRASASTHTQTFVGGFDETFQTAGTSRAPTASFTVINESTPEFCASIADILKFAARTATTTASVHASKAMNDAMKQMNKAAEVMEEQAKKASATAKATVQQAQSSVDESAQKAVRNTGRAARQAARLARQAARSARFSVGSTAPNEDAVTEEACGGVSRRSNSTRDAEANKNNEPSSVTESPFIHGRHTCDGCLTTPIIGKRFHAINRHDYDICEKCFLNYQGDELKFEEAKLGK